LYFIYDQGRDAVKLAEILHGEITLIGPTTGLAGLFLGPLWYYITFPGFLLTHGSPVGLAIWAITLSAVVMPFVWWLATKLFWNKPAGRLLDVLLGGVYIGLILFGPGSITSSTTIWNCLMAAPLMMASLYAFWQVRQSPKRSLIWLTAGFVTLALTLQSEFAYAIFYLPVLFCAIPWMTQRRRWSDFAAAITAVGVTLLPQLAFELRHQFIMTHSLFNGVTEKTKIVSWADQFAHRPLELVDVTVDFFTGPDINTWFIRILIIGIICIGAGGIIYRWWKARQTQSWPAEFFLKQLLLVFALIPYPFYLLWRGNNGNFFWYYFTPHFVFIFPLFVLGLKEALTPLWKRNLLGITTAALLLTSVLLPIELASLSHWMASIAAPINQAGYAVMLAAVKTAYTYQNPDHTATLIITPNISSPHYDYLFHWYGKQHHLHIPKTVTQDDDKQLILIIEQWGPEMTDYVKDQRKKLTLGLHRKRTALSGNLTIEEWLK